MSKYMKKVVILIIWVLMIPIIVSIAATETITITPTDTGTNDAVFKIVAQSKIKEVEIYKKDDTGNYTLFYKSISNDTNEKNCVIPKSRLSTESETYFKIVVTDENNNQKHEEFKIDKLPEVPQTTTSPSPSPTTTVTPSPTTTVTVTPTVSVTPSSTPTPTEVTKVALNQSSVTLDFSKKKTVQLSATITPKTVNTSLTWSSSNSKVATVSKTGKVTAKAGGQTTITVKTSNGKTAKCVVKVIVSSSSSTKPKSSRGDGYTQKITLGGRTFKLYKQSSGSYSGKHFNSVRNSSSGGTIANMGCGPSSIAIILSGYGYNYNPYDVGKRLMKNSKPSGLPSMQKELKTIGRSTKLHAYSSNYEKTYSEIKTALESGHQIVLYVGKKAPKTYWYKFTHSGYHFISILGIDSSNNKVYVGNPGITGGWFSLSTVVKARGNTNGNMAGWLEIY